ncbi:MAG: glycosyltransferase family 2 protein [Thermodesulfobacteriota bacterium]
MTVTLLIPTLNEIDGMKAIMPRVKNEWVDQLIIVDGGSVDGTTEYVKANGWTLIEQKQPGLRHAYNEALARVTGDIVITFSPDGNSIPELIPALIDKMNENYDMVIVSRYLDNARSADDDLLTAFGNRLFTGTVNLLYGSRYTDCMVMFRAFKTRIFYDLELNREDGFILAEKLFGTRIGTEPLLSVRAAKRKLRVAEIPGDEPPRIGGQRKLQIWRWGAAYYFQFVRELFVWR